MRTRRVSAQLLSQKVLLLARKGSSGAGWMMPSTSKARDVIWCSPGAGVPQSNVQNLQAKPRGFFGGGGGPKSLAAIQGPWSIWTSTAAIGAPQAAPLMVYRKSRRVTLAGADLRRSWLTVVNVHTVSL